jgi:phosphoserine phosphatase RsbU/P
LLRRGISGFVTVLLRHLSADRRSISFCSAGHPHFLLRRENGQATQVGQRYHAPLGVFETWSCSPEELRLSPGDLMLFYADGVIEARRSGELFGEARLIQWLKERADVPLEALPSALLADVLAFSHGALTDDAAIVAVQIGS